MVARLFSSAKAEDHLAGARGVFVLPKARFDRGIVAARVFGDHEDRLFKRKHTGRLTI